MQNLLEGLACFAIATAALSLAGTAILGIACYLINRLVETPRPTAIETEPEFDTTNAPAESTQESIDPSNPYAAGSITRPGPSRPGAFRELPSKLTLFAIELICFIIFFLSMLIGSVLIENSPYMLGNQLMLSYWLVGVLNFVICWLATCILKGILLSRSFSGPAWKIVVTIVVDQSIWLVSAVVFYVAIAVVVIGYGWFTGGLLPTPGIWINS
ncbi:MAG: hypothetical protein ACI9G1_003673 [Pirellulaceae bacterium]|jgi:hypothetical protein